MPTPDQIRAYYAARGEEPPAELLEGPGILSRLGSGVLGAMDVIPQIRQAIYDRPVTYWAGQVTGDEEMKRRAMAETVDPVYSQFFEAALPPERTGMAGAVARPILSTIGNVLTDPVTAAFGGAGALAGVGREAAAFVGPRVPAALEAARRAMLVGKIAGGAERTAAAGFAAEMLPAGIEQMGQAFETGQEQGFSPEAVEQGVGGAISAGFGALGVKHTVSPIKPWLRAKLDELRATKPELAKAGEAQAVAEGTGQPQLATEDVLPTPVRFRRPAEPQQLELPIPPEERQIPTRPPETRFMNLREQGQPQAPTEPEQLALQFPKRGIKQTKPVEAQNAPGPTITPPVAPPVTPPATPPVATKPGWLQENLDQLAASVKPKVKDQIEEMAANRLTAKEIAKATGLTVDQVRAVRMERGIPGQQDAVGLMGIGGGGKPSAEFEAWLQARKARGTPPPVTPPVAAPEAPPVAPVDPALKLAIEKAEADIAKRVAEGEGYLANPPAPGDKRARSFLFRSNSAIKNLISPKGPLGEDHPLVQRLRELTGPEGDKDNTGLLGKVILKDKPVPEGDLQSQLEASIEAKGGVPVTRETAPVQAVPEQPLTVAPEAPTVPVEPTTPPVEAPAGKTITLAPEKAAHPLGTGFASKAEAARARLAAKASKLGKGTLSTGIDPQDMADYAMVAADYMARGIQKRGQLVAQFVRDFGEGVREFIDQIIEKGRNLYFDAQAPVEGLVGNRKAVKGGVATNIDKSPTLTQQLTKMEEDLLTETVDIKNRLRDPQVGKKQRIILKQRQEQASQELVKVRTRRLAIERRLESETPYSQELQSLKDQLKNGEINKEEYAAAVDELDLGNTIFSRERTGPEDIVPEGVEGVIPKAGIATNVGELAPPELAPAAAGKVSAKRPETSKLIGPNTAKFNALEKKLRDGEITQEEFNAAVVEHTGLPQERLDLVKDEVFKSLPEEEQAYLTPEAAFDKTITRILTKLRRASWIKGNEDIAQASLLQAIKTWDPARKNKKTGGTMSLEGHALGLSRRLATDFWRREQSRGARQGKAVATGVVPGAEIAKAKVGEEGAEAAPREKAPVVEGPQMSAEEKLAGEDIPVNSPSFFNSLYQALTGKSDVDTKLEKIRKVASSDAANPDIPLLREFPEFKEKFGEDAREMALIYGMNLRGMKPAEIAAELFRESGTKKRFGTVQGKEYGVKSIEAKITKIREALGTNVGEKAKSVVLRFLADRYPTQPPIGDNTRTTWGPYKGNVLTPVKKVTVEQVKAMVEHVLYTAKETMKNERGREVGRYGSNITGLFSFPETLDVSSLVKEGWLAPTTIEGRTYYRAWHPEFSKLNVTKTGKNAVNLNMFGLQDLHEIASPLVAKGYAKAMEAAQYGVDLISTGVTDALRFSSAMLKQFGEGIKPFIKDIYNRAKGVWESVSFGPLPKEPKGEVIGSLGGSLQPFITNLFNAIGSRNPTGTLYPKTGKPLKQVESETIEKAIPDATLAEGVMRGISPEKTGIHTVHPKALEKPGFMNSGFNSMVDIINDPALKEHVVNQLKAIDPLMSRNVPRHRKAVIKDAMIRLASDMTVPVETALKGIPLTDTEGLAVRTLANTMQKEQITLKDKFLESLQMADTNPLKADTVRQAIKNYVEGTRRAQVTLLAAAEDGTALSRGMNARKIASWSKDSEMLFKERFIDSARYSRIPKGMARKLADVWYDINNWDSALAEKYMRDQNKTLPQLIDDFNHTLRASLNPSWLQKIIGVWKPTLFTWPGTVANVASNTSVTAIRRVEERVQSGIDNIRTYTAQNFPGMEFLGKDRLHRSMPLGVAVEVSRRAAAEAIPRAIGDIADTVKMRPIGSSRTIAGSLQDIDPITSTPVIPGKLGEAINAPMKLNEAGDNVSKAFALHHYLGNASWTEAMNRAEKSGLPKAEVTKLFWRLYDEAQAFRAAFDGGNSKVWENHTDHVWNRKKLFEVHEKAVEGMKTDVFQKELTGIARQINLAVTGTPVEFVVPFRKTPYNIMLETIKRTPLGAIEAIKMIRKVQQGLPIEQRSYKNAIAKMAEDGSLDGAQKLLSQSMVGTIGTALLLAVMGEDVQGGGPLDAREEEVKKLTGWRPYSIKAGDTYVTYNRLEPLSSLVGIATDLRDAAARGDMTKADKIAQVLFSTVAENLTNKTFLSGLEGLFTAWSDPKRYGGRLTKQLEASLVPNTAYLIPIGTLAKALDPVYRQTEPLAELSGDWDKSPLKAKIPGLSKELLPQYGPFGEERVRGGNFFTRLLLPTEISKEKRTPEALIAMEADKIGFPIPPPRKYKSYGTAKVYYTPQEMKSLGEARKKAIIRLQEVIKDPSYLRLPDNESDPSYEIGDKTKRDVMQRIFSEFQRGVGEKMKPDLLRRARTLSAAMRSA
jgi:hypothetical protein